MFTVSDIASAFSVSKQTIRQWTTEFGDYLAPDATPAKGQARLYNDTDLAVFDLIAQYREQHIGYNDIHAALAAGERGQAPDINQPTSQQEQERPSTALSNTAVFEQFAIRIAQQFETQMDQLTANFSSQVNDLKNQRAKLQDQLERERAARLEAEKGRTAAETKLEMLHDQEKGEGERDARPGLLDRLFGRK